MVISRRHLVLLPMTMLCSIHNFRDLGLSGNCVLEEGFESDLAGVPLTMFSECSLLFMSVFCLSNLASVEVHDCDRSLRTVIITPISRKEL